MLELNGWPGVAVRHFLGQVPEAAVLDAIASADPTTQIEPRCEGYFYVGMSRLLLGNRNGASEMFKKSTATPACRGFVEYKQAGIELARLK